VEMADLVFLKDMIIEFQMEGMVEKVEMFI